MLATGTKISVISRSLYEKINSENEPVELLSYEGDDMFCIGYGVVKVCGAVFIKQCMFSGKKILKDHLFLVIEGSPVYDCVIGIDIMGKIPELNPIPEDLMASLVLEEGENSTNTKTLLIREQRKKGEKDFPGVILGWEAIAALTKKWSIYLKTISQILQSKFINQIKTSMKMFKKNLGIINNFNYNNINKLLKLITCLIINKL